MLVTQGGKSMRNTKQQFSLHNLPHASRLAPDDYEGVLLVVDGYAVADLMSRALRG